MFNKMFFVITCSLTLKANNLHQLIQRANQLQHRMQDIMQNIKEQVPDIDQILAQKSTPLSLDPTEINQENVEKFIEAAQILTQQMQHLKQSKKDKSLYDIQLFYQLPQQLKTILHNANHLTYEQQAQQYTQTVQDILHIIEQTISPQYISMTAQTLLQTILLKLGQQPTTVNDLLMIPLLLHSYTTLKNIFTNYPTNTDSHYQQVIDYLIRITHPDNSIAQQIQQNSDTPKTEQLLQIIHKTLTNTYSKLL